MASFHLHKSRPLIPHLSRFLVPVLLSRQTMFYRKPSVSLKLGLLDDPPLPIAQVPLLGRHQEEASGEL